MLLLTWNLLIHKNIHISRIHTQNYSVFHKLVSISKHLIHVHALNIKHVQKWKLTLCPQFSNTLTDNYITCGSACTRTWDQSRIVGSRVSGLSMSLVSMHADAFHLPVQKNLSVSKTKQCNDSHPHNISDNSYYQVTIVWIVSRETKVTYLPYIPVHIIMHNLY